MSLEFSRRKSSEGLNDYDEHLDEETNERTWRNPGEFEPYNQARAQLLADQERKRIEESKRQTMERIESITATPGEIERKRLAEQQEQQARMAERERKEAEEFKFIEMMMQRGRDYGQQKQNDIEAPRSPEDTSLVELSSEYQDPDIPPYAIGSFTTESGKKRYYGPDMSIIPTAEEREETKLDFDPDPTPNPPNTPDEEPPKPDDFILPKDKMS